MPLAMRTDVIDQTLAIAMHPAYDCKTAIVSMSMILCLAQSPEAHTYIARKEIVENVVEMCEQKQKIVSEQSSDSSQSQQRKKEDPMVVNALKYVTIPPPPTISASLTSCPLFFILSLSLSLSLGTFLHTIYYFYPDAMLALHWLKLDLVLHVFYLIPFHLTFCANFSI